MAIVIPQRKKRKPRSVIEYRRGNVMCLRQNPGSIRNPRTFAQQRNRSLFSLLQAMQSPLTPLLRRGFLPGRTTENDYKIGSYQMALGYNLRHAGWYDAPTKTWECNFAQFALAEQRGVPPRHLLLQRKGRTLELHFTWRGTRNGEAGILWAVYNLVRGQWYGGIEDTHLKKGHSVWEIPEAWCKEHLVVLVGFGRDAEERGTPRGTFYFPLVAGLHKVSPSKKRKYPVAVSMQRGVKEASVSSSSQREGVAHRMYAVPLVGSASHADGVRASRSSPRTLRADGRTEVLILGEVSVAYQRRVNDLPSKPVCRRQGGV